MKQFVKSGDLKLENGGYLMADGNPVGNAEFVKAQKSAEYVIKFAELAKGKNFKTTKVDSLADLRMEVMAALSEKEVRFVEMPKMPEQSLTKQLTSEAMAFVGFHENTEKTAKINQFLQQYSVMLDFETHGLFFDQEIVKLNEIYTVQQVVDAVTSCIELL